MARYELIENGYVFQHVEADSAEAALDECGEPSIGDYGDGTETQTTTWYAINEEDADDKASRKYTMQPDAPSCTEAEHDWRSPLAIVGGIKENPGVWSTGGASITMIECCMHCGCKRTTDTAATDMSDGTTYERVTHEPGAFADELAALRRGDA